MLSALEGLQFSRCRKWASLIWRHIIKSLELLSLRTSICEHRDKHLLSLSSWLKASLAISPCFSPAGRHPRSTTNVSQKWFIKQMWKHAFSSFFFCSINECPSSTCLRVHSYWLRGEGGEKFCQNAVKNVAWTAFQGKREPTWECVRAREGAFVMTLLRLVWDLPLTAAAW